MFIVLPIHKENLRDMINRDTGLVDQPIKLGVLKMLKPFVCTTRLSHGDIKDILGL